jgi:hypothetical protein
LDADNLDLRIERLGGDGDPGNQPSTTDRYDNGIEVGAIG